MIERRFLPVNDQLGIHLRSGGVTTIRGYTAVFHSAVIKGSEYKLYEGAVERIRRGAFDRALKEQHDVRCLFNHNPDNLLGRTSNGTCTLSVDPIGLQYVCQIDHNDPDHLRVISKIERGDLTGSSFAFKPTKVSWSKASDGTEIRWIEDVQMYDCGPVTFPAYEAATSFVRNDIEAERAICLQSPGTVLELGDNFAEFKRSLDWAAIKRDQLNRLVARF